MRIAEDANIDAPETAVEWTKELYRAVDSTDEAGFADAFTEKGRLTWGNQDMIKGAEGIEEYIGTFFDSIDTLDHTFSGIWLSEGIEAADDILTLEADVTYTRRDGSRVTVPATTIIERDEEKAKAARIYVDLSPL